MPENFEKQMFAFTYWPLNRLVSGGGGVNKLLWISVRARRGLKEWADEFHSRISALVGPKWPQIRLFP